LRLASKLTKSEFLMEMVLVVDLRLKPCRNMEKESQTYLIWQASCTTEGILFRCYECFPANENESCDTPKAAICEARVLQRIC